MKSASYGVLLLALTIVVGCGSQPYKYENENPLTDEQIFANDVVQYLQDMKNSNKTQGPKSIDFEGYEEGIAGYGDSPPVGDHASVYAEIEKGVAELKQKAKSSGSRAEVGKMIDALLEKTSGLPTKEPSIE